jgi:hypothetical protein
MVFWMAQAGAAHEGGYGTIASPPPWPFPDPRVESMVFPRSFDWRAENGFTPVKDQGVTPGCYPCWAFSLIGACESVFKIATGIDYDLSEQFLLDCNTSGYGCNGGFVDGWTALRDYGAVTSACYPYTAEADDCHAADCGPAGWIAGVYRVPYSVQSIKYALMYHGCLSCSMTIYNDIMSYSGGCYENPGTRPINHGVVIAGWDDDMCDGEGAWIVRNSWGDDWGEGGVAYMKYGTANIGRHAQWFEYSPVLPGPGLHYGLFMPGTSLGADDWFVLERRYGNASGKTVRFLEIILLDVYGDFWFYPEFSTDFNWVEHTVAPDEYLYEIILLFQWPEHAASFHGVRFYGAALDPAAGSLLAFDMIEWEAR